MYSILNVTDTQVALNGAVLSKARALQMIVILRNEYPNAQFRLVYLMAEGE